jgi:hypothetical protein
MPLVGKRKKILNEKCKHEIQTNIPMISSESKPKQHIPKNSNEQTK